MKNKRKSLIFHMVLFILFLAAGLSVGRNIQDGANRKLYVFASRFHGTSFTRTGMDRLEKSGYEAGYRGEGRLMTESYRAKKMVSVIGTNENYPYLAEKRMQEGAWFNGLHVKRQRQIVVLNEKAAMEFFGTTHALSNYIKIDGMDYMVIGIVREEDDEAKLYIPYGNLENCHGLSEGVSIVFCNLENSSETGIFLQLAGMDPEDVEIFSMSEYQKVITMRFGLILFLIMIFLAIWQWKGIRKDIGKLEKQVKTFLEGHYISECWRMFGNKQLRIRIWRLAGRALVILLLCLCVRIEPSLPGEAVLEGRESIWECIRGVLSYYMQTGINIQEFVRFNEWNELSFVLFFTTVLTGILLFKDAHHVSS